MRALTPTVSLLVVALTSFSCVTKPPQPDANGRVRIQTTAYSGWKHCYALDNGLMQVIVAPEAGRIVHIGFRGHGNMLRLDPQLAGKPFPPDATWVNLGGDWFWPAAQSAWPGFAGADWPPPAVMAEQAWQAEAWSDAAGNHSCMMTRRYGAPLHVMASRLITLDRRLAQLRIRQQLRRIGPALTEAPVTLWNITQLPQVQRVFLPADAAAGDGFKTLLFDPPSTSHIERINGMLVFDARRDGEFKIGTLASNHWIAAELGGALILERMQTTATGTFPDGGCSVELYSNSGSGYTEIETLSPEQHLATGEASDNLVVVDCHFFPPNLNNQQAAEKVADILAAQGL